MSYASPTNNFDFESLFLEEEQEVPLNFYQSPTESLLSTSSSGTDHTNSSNEQQQITYDVISDGYVFGNDFDVNAQKQKNLKQEDLAAANPFYNQASATNTNNQFSPLNPLNNFLYNQKPGFMGYQNPQLMGQLGMYFPQTFPNVFPQFGNQPFPFPNNNLIYSSPNTSPIGLATSPNSNNSNGATPSSNTLNNNSTTATTTQPAESKTKASRRKSAKKNTKSSTSTTTPSTSSKTEEPTPTTITTTTTTTSTPTEQKSAKASTPEPTDSDNSNQSSEKEENDSSSSSSEKKSEEKKRKRKSKKDGKESKALTPEEEKELKRQRRLIKNRESAQASRERKKIYIQGLEKKVDGLAQEFNELQGQVLTLEEENEILRQRLKMLGEHVEEPSHKKRKMAPMTSSGQMKVPIPMDSRSYANPFMLDFWNLFGMQQQLQQTQQAPDMAQLNPRAGSSSRRVVMFIMLFCVAMFLVLPHSSDIKFDSQTATTTTEQSESVTSRLSPASRKLASTDQKETMIDVSIDASQKPFVDEDFKKNVAEIYQSFNDLRSEASENSSEESSEKPIIDDLASRINVVFDADKISLSFPKSILVKKEEESDDDEMVDEEKFSNSTYDEKMSSLSTKLLKEICRVVNH